MKKKIIGLIPSRLKSTRLKEKPLLKLAKLPIVIHTYRRALISKLLDAVIICKKYNTKCIMTSKKHLNGTERIAEAYLKLKKKYDLIVDIQGDEPLIDTKNIDEVVKFHKKIYLELKFI